MNPGVANLMTKIKEDKASQFVLNAAIESVRCMENRNSERNVPRLLHVTSGLIFCWVTTQQGEFMCCVQFVNVQLRRWSRNELQNVPEADWRVWLAFWNGLEKIDAIPAENISARDDLESLEFICRPIAVTTPYMFPWS
jgi:hypothetical protein